MTALQSFKRTKPRKVPLVGAQQLVVKQESSGNLVEIVGADGKVTLSMRVTPAGPVLELEGCGLLIRATGDLAVQAERVAIHGREGVAITSGGDAIIGVAGDLETTARIQNITAVLGNVNVKANDDIRLNGERVLVNC